MIMVNGSSSATFIIISSFFPFGYASQMGTFNYQAMNFERTITLSNLFTQKFTYDLTMGDLILTQLASTAFWLLILLYVWPLYISPNADMPLRWYYPLTCQCLRKVDKIQAVHPKGDEDESVSQSDQELMHTATEHNNTSMMLSE